MKQKGLNIDSSSERNLVKKWDGVDFTSINFEDKKFVYKKLELEDMTQKDKKGTKKETKKPSNQFVQAQTQNATKSRDIETFKTWRQKSIFEEREKCFEFFITKYRHLITEMSIKVDQAKKDH